MKTEIAKEWTTALRSGDYQQGRLALHDRNRFCCLGVLCDIYRKATGRGQWLPSIDELGDCYVVNGCENSTVPPAEVREWVGVTDCQINYLINLNDDGTSFAQIADFIEGERR